MDVRGKMKLGCRFALMNLEEKQEHTRNWRPQLLVLMDNMHVSVPLIQEGREI